MHSDGYRLFASFWWLIFPIGWGIAGMMRAFLSHQRAQQALEIVKGYADQGKEIPPELLSVLQRPEREGRTATDRSRSFLMAGFVFSALTAGFAVLIIGRIAGDDHEAFIGMSFVAVLMAGFAAACFLMAQIWARDSKRLDRP